MWKTLDLKQHCLSLYQPLTSACAPIKQPSIYKPLIVFNLFVFIRTSTTTSQLRRYTRFKRSQKKRESQGFRNHLIWTFRGYSRLAFLSLMPWAMHKPPSQQVSMHLLAQLLQLFWDAFYGSSYYSFKISLTHQMDLCLCPVCQIK